MNYEQTINLLIEKEILEKSKEKKYKNIHLVIESLFTAIPNNKIVLVKIEQEFENNLTQNKLIKETQKQNIRKILKREWYQYWTSNEIEKDQEKFFNKYFTSYTAKQQQILLKNTNQTNLPIKEENELNQILKNFKNGNVNDLEKWSSATQKINTQEANRIFKLLEYKKIPENGLNVLNKIIEKFNITGNIYPAQSVILSENPDDFKQLIEVLIKNYSKKWFKNQDDERNATCNAIRTVTNIGVEYKDGLSQDIFMLLTEILEENSKKDITTIMKNIDYLVKIPSISKDIGKIKLYSDNKNGSGIELYINILNEPSKSGKTVLSNVGLDGKTEDSENLVKLINSNYLHLALSKELVNTNQKVKVTPKI